MKNAFVGNDARTRASRFAMVISSLIAGLVISQPESTGAATSSKSSTAHMVADAKVAYKTAYMNLVHSRFLQMTQIEKSIEWAQLTALGEKNPATKKQFGHPPQYETNVARVDGSNKSQPITLYEVYSRSIGGEDGYLSVGSSMFADVGKGWTRSTTVPRDIADGLLTLGSIPPLDTFINLGVKQIYGGFVVSGYINVKRYYAEDANEMLSMALFPNMSTALKNRIIAKTYEHDTVTIKRVGNGYFVTNDFSARWGTMTGSDFAAILGVPASDVSPYLKSVTSETDDTTQYSYAALTVKLPGTVKKLLAGKTVTGSVYGANT